EGTDRKQAGERSGEDTLQARFSTPHGYSSELHRWGSTSECGEVHAEQRAADGEAHCRSSDAGAAGNEVRRPVGNTVGAEHTTQAETHMRDDDPDDQRVVGQEPR